MGYFEGLAGAAFKKGQEGKTLYYPWGVLGKGRVLPDDEAERRARAFLVRYYKVSIPACALLAVLMGWWGALTAGVVTIAWFLFANRRMVGHLPLSGERLTLKEGYRNSAVLHRASTLWLLLVASALLAAVGIFLAASARTAAGRNAALLGLAVILPCACAVAYLLKVKREAGRGQGPQPTAVALEMQGQTTGDQQVRGWVIIRTVVLLAIALAALTAVGYTYGNRDRLFPAGDTVVIYGRHECGITRLVRQGLEAQGIPYLFADADIPAIDDELWYKLGPRFKPQRITFPVVHVAGRLLLTPTADQVQQALAEHRAAAGPGASARDYSTLLHGADPAPHY